MSQVDEFHYCAGRGGRPPLFGGALPFSVADCPHCTEADYPPAVASQLDRLAALEQAVARGRELHEHRAWGPGVCRHCNSIDGDAVRYPCPTIRFLDGTEAP